MPRLRPHGLVRPPGAQFGGGFGVGLGPGLQGGVAGQVPVEAVEFPAGDVAGGLGDPGVGEVGGEGGAALVVRRTGDTMFLNGGGVGLGDGMRYSRARELDVVVFVVILGVERRTERILIGEGRRQCHRTGRRDGEGESSSSSNTRP